LFNLFEAAMIYTPLWDINNAETYCETCHKKTNNYLKNSSRIRNEEKNNE